MWLLIFRASGLISTKFSASVSILLPNEANWKRKGEKVFKILYKNVIFKKKRLHFTQKSTYLKNPQPQPFLFSVWQITPKLIKPTYRSLSSRTISCRTIQATSTVATLQSGSIWNVSTTAGKRNGKWKNRKRGKRGGGGWVESWAKKSDDEKIGRWRRWVFWVLVFRGRKACVTKEFQMNLSERPILINWNFKDLTA